jgi:hypothetical protein
MKTSIMVLYITVGIVHYLPYIKPEVERRFTRNATIQIVPLRVDIEGFELPNGLQQVSSKSNAERDSKANIVTFDLTLMHHSSGEICHCICRLIRPSRPRMRKRWIELTHNIQTPQE